jgi:hypothetical protein
MPINDSYVFDAGWLFFAAWSIIVAVVSVAAFRRDLFPSTKLELAHHPQTATPPSPPENHPN